MARSPIHDRRWWWTGADARRRRDHRVVRGDGGSVVWWTVAVMGVAVAMLSGLGLLATHAVAAARAQGVADLAALAAVGAEESGRAGRSESAAVDPGGRVAQAVCSANGAGLVSVSAMVTVSGRTWSVRVRLEGAEARAAASPGPVHPWGPAGP
ncbi:MAG: hypothetical protein R2754_06850 [Microthrixaceae bacterium]